LNSRAVRWTLAGCLAAALAAALIVISGSRATASGCSLPRNWSRVGSKILRGPTKWVYASQNLDLYGAGPYTLDFGPVPASFNWPKTITAFAVEAPPGWNVIQARGRSAGPHMATVGGQRFLQGRYTVSAIAGQAGTCRGFKVWIYN
jgi:hypothetical protein